MSSIKHIMWNYVGLVRTTPRLARAIQDLRNLEVEIERFYRAAALTDELHRPAQRDARRADRDARRLGEPGEPRLPLPRVARRGRRRSGLAAGLALRPSRA